MNKQGMYAFIERTASQALLLPMDKSKESHGVNFDDGGNVMDKKSNWTKSLGSFVSQKVSEAGGLDGIINSRIEETGRGEGMKSAAELISEKTRPKKSIFKKRKEGLQTQEKFFLIVKSPSHSEAARADKIKKTASNAISNPTGFLKSIISSELDPSDIFSPDSSLPAKEYHSYRIDDKEGRLRYTADWRGGYFHTFFDIHDAEGTLIGSLKQPDISIGDILEHDVQHCSVIYQEEEICALTRYISFGDFYIGKWDGPVEISCCDNDITYNVKYKEEHIAKISIVPKLLKDGFTDDLVIEYQNKKHEHLAVLFAIAVATLKLK